VRPKSLPCFGPNCRATRPSWQFFCDACWKAIPGWLRVQIAREKEACRAAHTAHTQRLLELRDMAVKELEKPREEREAS
jgi:hypothetical protein